jgi:hypothetical protein
MNEPRDLADEDRDAEVVRALLKRSLAAMPSEETPDLLPGIQRRIRRLSRGKFFADGWSTAQTRATYVLVGLFTIVIVVLAYCAIGALSSIGPR